MVEFAPSCDGLNDLAGSFGLMVDGAWMVWVNPVANNA